MTSTLAQKKINFPNGMECYYISSREETEYIYSEIFVDQQYLKNGITIQEGDCIFDLGANIGLFALFLNQLPTRLEIYSFEPIPDTFAVLSENVKLHSLNDISLFNYGLSSENNPEQIFTFYPNMAGNSTTKPDDTIADEDDILDRDSNAEKVENLYQHLFAEKTQIKCAIRTLSSVIEELKIESIDLLKIDVEGEEYEVLKGIEEKHWSKIKQIIGEFHDKAGRLEKVKTLLSKHGFTITLEKREGLPSTFVNIYNLYAMR
ncbi:FkbM family methyltransferase [Anabaena cylindrica UHCC 0172]|uniref:FkbM family methyltransferase n=1 Tax=Anabaena cylindrica TaxID=1165 RepID=UPI002B1F6925|nr:FkbM family methyltransferase [Anabaena cylindrica]MEA5554215.1 FkbM family methyltransferase [Anabaena cylindrica UHCC 0172]